MGFGRIDSQLFLSVITAASLFAALTDLIWGRIFNGFTAPLLLAGIAFSAYFGGWAGTAESLLGAAVGLLLYGWIFWVGAMGGGDVKFLMALGAWGGSRYAIHVAILGVLLGGILSVAALVIKGRAKGFLKKMYRFLLTVLIRELELERPAIDHGFTVPFGVPIAIAAVWTACCRPLESWGIGL